MNTLTTMLINRTENWFIYEDSKVNPFYCAILILEKLHTRPIKGLYYNRVELINELINRKSQEALKTLDAALVLLSSRSLIRIEEVSGFSSKLFISEKGVEALKDYRKELKNANRKN